MCYLTTPQGELVTSMMLTDVGKKTDILVTGFNRIGCYVKMLVVGVEVRMAGPQSSEVLAQDTCNTWMLSPSRRALISVPRYAHG